MLHKDGYKEEECLVTTSKPRAVFQPPQIAAKADDRSHHRRHYSAALYAAVHGIAETRQDTSNGLADLKHEIASDDIEFLDPFETIRGPGISISQRAPRGIPLHGKLYQGHYVESSYACIIRVLRRCARTPSARGDADVFAEYGHVATRPPPPLLPCHGSARDTPG